MINPLATLVYKHINFEDPNIERRNMHASLLSQETIKVLAYLDPVSQGAILQAILGALLAITLFVRAFWSKIKSVYEQLTGKTASKQESTTEDSA